MPIAPAAVPEPGLRPHPSGARRLNSTMLAALDRADGFRGLPPGMARPMHFLAAFQEALPYLGLPSLTCMLVSWLVKMTRVQDWEEGSRPIAWPSAREQAHYLGVSEARVKALNRVLFEAGILVLRDSPQGRRYGRRGADGRIIEAYGFDLCMLALRYDEFVRLAAEGRLERQRMRALRGRVTLARRGVRQIGEALAVVGQRPAGWVILAYEVAGLVAAARRCARSDDLAMVVHGLERLKAQAEQWLLDTSKPVETSPQGLENEPLNRDTNLDSYPEKDTVVARERGSSAASAVPPSAPSSPVKPVESALRLKAPQLLELAPRLNRHVLGEAPAWSDIVNAAASGLRPELGVSPSLWGEACRIMGREQAAVALAIVSTKKAGHFTRGPGGYFAGMVRMAARGELHLDRTIRALREARWGKTASGFSRPSRRLMNPAFSS